jgi:putative SOS response-associated peptidase YedK
MGWVLRNCFSSAITNIRISGLVPFWTKRNPDYGSKMKTINCRDDSLFEDRGMWTTMKKQKRCIIVAQGFYEWLKKNTGKEKIPHFTKRKDGQLMCFAGLWDRVQFEGKHVSQVLAAAMQRKSVAEPSLPDPQPVYHTNHALCTCCDHD